MQKILIRLLIAIPVVVIGALAWVALSGPRHAVAPAMNDMPSQAATATAHDPDAADAAAIAAGKALYATKSCAGCHGPAGGGGMCPSLLDEAWIYGDEDAVLVDLIRHGSAGMRSRGHARLAGDNGRGDMPALGAIVSDEEARRILAWIRSSERSAAPR